MEAFRIHQETSQQVPIIVSVPHCGVGFPDELVGEYKPELVASPDDTDWFVETLYDFAPSMGMKMITSTYSRWIIDLNRDPENKPLYSDGRMITGICPVKNFKGENLYVDERTEVESEEVKRRVELYYEPYHNSLEQLLQEYLKKYGKVLLWDSHSIRQYVPSINPKKFPDLILGDNDGLSSGDFLTEIASKSLAGSGYSFENNYLFKGGYITRKYGQPKIHQYALQLEMTKLNYMDDLETSYHPGRAGRMQETLKRMFEKLITVLLL